MDSDKKGAPTDADTSKGKKEEPAGGKPSDTDNGDADPNVNDESFADWLAKQSDEVKAAFSLHDDAAKKTHDADTANLVSAHEKVKKEHRELRDKLYEHDQEERRRREEKGDFKALAEEGQAKLDELVPKVEQLTTEVETLRQRAEAAEEVVKEYVAIEMSSLTLSEGIQELLKAKSPTEQLEWLTKHKDELPTQKKGVPPGENPEGAKAAGEGLTDEQKRAQSLHPRNFF